jgi:hypothetical protein
VTYSENVPPYFDTISIYALKFFYFPGSRVCILNTSFYSLMINGPISKILPYTRLERLARDQHSTSLDSLVMKKMKCCELHLGPIKKMYYLFLFLGVMEQHSFHNSS